MLRGRAAHAAAGRHRARVASPLRRRLTELEFSLPSPRVSASALNAALRSLGYDVPRLAFRDLDGYLKGFIDLVFEHGGRYYVARLEIEPPRPHAGRLRPRRAAAAMAEHSYTCSTCSTRVAVDRYLQAPRARLPPRHAFRRRALPVRARRAARLGRTPTARPAGVFHDRPSAATLARLDALFATRAGEAA